MFGQPETVLRRTLAARIDVLTELVKDHERSQIENFPELNISMDFRMAESRDVTTRGNPIGSGQ
jgi:hypothetical protein